MSNDFYKNLETLSDRIKNSINNIQTEEATKMSFVVPFFQILEYDVYNPTEFVPEFTADIGVKKGEKVDYAIMLHEKPLILVEAKSCHEKLDRHAEQLLRYFGCTESKFGILTNGIVYRFYTDLDDPNKMDNTPFLVVDMLNLKESTVSQLSKFKKSNFNVDSIINSAEELKALNKISNLFTNEFENPSEDFIKFILSEVYEGMKTQNIIDKYKPLIKKSFNSFVSEIMNSKIKDAFNSNTEESTGDIDEISAEESEEDDKIITTQEEIESFFIIKSILAEKSLTNFINYKDTESYFGILVNNNVRKWVCRLFLSDKRKAVIINGHNDNKKVYLEKIDDLYNLKIELTNATEKHI